MSAPVSHYLAAFTSRREICRALHRLTELQQQFITDQDYDLLVDLLGHKQQLIDALNDASRNPAELWQSWRSDRDRLPGDMKQQCEFVLEETETLLRELLRLEESGTELLTTRRDATAQALRDVNQGGLARLAYQPSTDLPSSRRLDLDL